MRRSETVRAVRLLLAPRWAALLAAVALGAAAQASALGLAGVAAWLITRAWQAPPVLDLSVAVVAVRTFGISRGVLHYCERLVTHDTALRAAGTARTRLYRRLAHGPAQSVTALHSGELLARVGADVESLADVLVRAVLPIAVAAVLGLGATAVIAVISPAAAAVLAGCLLIAGVGAPVLTARAAAGRERLARARLADRDAAVMLALEHGPELRVGGVLPTVLAGARAHQRDWAADADAAAAPAAIAAAVPVAAVGVSVLGAIAAAVGIAGTVAPTTLAVLMLLPLSAFEATTALPGAATALTRARIAARRLLTLAPGEAGAPVSAPAAPDPAAPLRAHALVSGHRGASRVGPLDVDLPAGSRLALTGPSGAGKTTLLMTLAGLCPPLAGRVEVAGADPAALPEPALRAAVVFCAEDAHLFATTVRDNLLVARGDATDTELRDALARVGLAGWLAGLPDGLATVLVGGAAAVSAGQRRRLLLARATLCRARVLLLDEPTEHLDRDDAQDLLARLLDPAGGLFGADRTVVVATHQRVAAPDCSHLVIDGPVASRRW